MKTNFTLFDASVEQRMAHLSQDSSKLEHAVCAWNGKSLTIREDLTTSKGIFSNLLRGIHNFFCGDEAVRKFNNAFGCSFNTHHALSLQKIGEDPVLLARVFARETQDPKQIAAWLKTLNPKTPAMRVYDESVPACPVKDDPYLLAAFIASCAQELGNPEAIVELVKALKPDFKQDNFAFLRALEKFHGPLPQDITTMDAFRGVDLSRGQNFEQTNTDYHQAQGSPHQAIAHINYSRSVSAEPSNIGLVGHTLHLFQQPSK